MWALGFGAADFAVRGAVCNFKYRSARKKFYTSSESNDFAVIKLKSLILAQIERWRHALHMQVERQHDV